MGRTAFWCLGERKLISHAWYDAPTHSSFHTAASLSWGDKKVESGEIKVAGIHGTEYERGGHCVERALVNFRGVSSSLWQSNSLYKVKAYQTGRRMNRKPLSELAQGRILMPASQSRGISEKHRLWGRVLGKTCLSSEAKLAQQLRLLWTYRDKPEKYWAVREKRKDIPIWMQSSKE